VNTPLRVAVSCHDAGGARALIPVVRELTRRRARVEAFMAGPAYAIWQKECPEAPPHSIDDGILPARASDYLSQYGSNILLSGSGLYNRMEHVFRNAARGLNIPVVALLDSWLNYRERFERFVDGRTALSWPDWICAIDSLSERGMKSIGFPEDRLILTGPPQLEETVRRMRTLDTSALRLEEALPTGDDLVITFFSDPFYLKPDGRPCRGIGGLMRDDGSSLYGYTAPHILKVFIEELQSVLENGPRVCHLIVRPHPLEDIQQLRVIIQGLKSSSRLHLSIRSDRTPAEWIAMSDLTAGMMSMALLEGAVAGKPALSIEIGLQNSGEEDPCIANQLGYTFPIFNHAALTMAVRDLAERRFDALRPTPQSPLPFDGAAQRVANAVQQAVAAGVRS
jgi:hypothetical protein